MEVVATEVTDNVYKCCYCQLCTLTSHLIVSRQLCYLNQSAHRLDISLLTHFYKIKKIVSSSSFGISIPIFHLGLAYSKDELEMSNFLEKSTSGFKDLAVPSGEHCMTRYDKRKEVDVCGWRGP